MKRSSCLGEFLRYTILNILGMAVLSWHWIKKKNCFHFKIQKPSLQLTGSTFSLGAPSLIAEMASEKVIPAQTISLLRGLFVIIPAAFLLSAWFGMQGVWLSYPVTEGLVTVAALVMLLKIFQKQKIIS